MCLVCRPLQRKKSFGGSCYSGEMYTFSVQNYNDNKIVLGEFRTGSELQEEKIFS